MSNCQYGVFCTYPKIALKNDTKCQNEKKFGREMQAERSHKAANCVMSLLMLRDATKALEQFEKSMKVYLNLAKRTCRSLPKQSIKLKRLRRK
ncbi:hypothetical protein IKQ19_11955 [Candidatus Saccharibacteria bacterium]|nr:hypothetical protein [Candidatus Saccharibacteria bacterium]